MLVFDTSDLQKYILYIKNLKYPHRTPVLFKAQYPFKTTVCSHKFKLLFCTKKTVLKVGFKDFWCTIINKHQICFEKRR